MAKETERDVAITPAGLEELCKDIWGDGWRSKFSDVLGISYSQLHRYMTVYKGQRIPQVVVVALEGLRMLKTGPEGKPILSIAEYRRPAVDATPVKFVQEKKPRPLRVIDQTPVADFFSEKPAEPTPAPAPEPPPAPAPNLAKASAKLGKALAPKPAKGKAETAGTGTGKAKTGTAPAKKPAKVAKAEAPAKRPAPKRASLKTA